MAYCTLPDIQKRMPQFVLTATSKPSTTDVPDMILDAEQELEAQLTNMGYVMPVTVGASPLSYQIVLAMAAQATIWRILEARNAAVGGEATSKSAERAAKYVSDRLTWLLDPKNPFELVDCERSSIQVVKPAEVLQRIEWPANTEGENWPFSQRTTLSQVF